MHIEDLGSRATNLDLQIKKMLDLITSESKDIDKYGDSFMKRAILTILRTSPGYLKIDHISELVTQ